PSAQHDKHWRVALRRDHTNGSAGASPSTPFVTLSVSEGAQMLRLRLSMIEASAPITLTDAAKSKI
ncbi:MAG: hypothetical protein RMM08_10610, partial [Armatimonadota bacterium]|nr:hypothetical protein [Armatimonadota bacterium]